MKTIEEFCNTHEACDDGRRWALDNCQTMREAWDKARPDWVIWIATRPGVLTHRELVQFALFCAEQCKQPDEDRRVTHCRSVAADWTVGLATDLECARAAANAADAAASAAYAAYAATYAATYAAAYAASAAYAAANAAAYAAYAAANAADCAAYAATYAAASAAQIEWLHSNTNPNLE